MVCTGSRLDPTTPTGLRVGGVGHLIWLHSYGNLGCYLNLVLGFILLPSHNKSTCGSLSLVAITSGVQVLVKQHQWDDSTGLGVPKWDVCVHEGIWELPWSSQAGQERDFHQVHPCSHPILDLRLPTPGEEVVELFTQSAMF